MGIYTTVNCHCLMRWQFILTYLLFNCYGEISNSFIVTVIRLNAAYGIVLYQSTVCDYHCNEFSLREHLTVNQGVVGSSPTGGAIPMLQKGNSQKDHKILWSFCYSKAAISQYLVFGCSKESCVNLGKLF